MQHKSNDLFIRVASVLGASTLLFACRSNEKMDDFSDKDNINISDLVEPKLANEAQRIEKVQELVKKLSDESLETRENAYIELRDTFMRKRDIPVISREIERVSSTQAKLYLKELISFMDGRWRLPDKGWTENPNECVTVYEKAFEKSGYLVSIENTYDRSFHSRGIIIELNFKDFSRDDKDNYKAVDLILALEPETLVLSDLFQDIGFVSLLSNLGEISLTGALYADLSPLKDLPNLVRLNLANANIAGIGILNKFPKLKVLNVTNTPVNDLTPLSALTDLRELSLEGTKVTDLTPVNKLSKLGILNLKNTPIIDLSPLKGLSQLREIELSNTKVTDLAPLKDLPSLKVVYFKNNRYVDLAPFDGESFAIIK